ncbi:zinc-binding protein A33-like [Anableps anableps]
MSEENQVGYSRNLRCEDNQCADCLSEPLCLQHSEKLSLFCEDQQRLVCVACRDSTEQKSRRFIPVNEADQHYKKQLLKSVESLRTKHLLFEQVKETFDETAVGLKKQLQNAEEEIKQQFKNLRQFLEDEEEARIAALRREEKQKSKVIREKIVGLGRDIAALSEAIRATEEETRAADVFFLQNRHRALESVQQHLQLQAPELIAGALIDEAKHLGNLAYSAWIRMKDMVSFSPVILNPNTAHPELILSEDLTGVTHGQKHKLPDNPERFDQSLSVLGSEGFHSGFHSWDVEVRHDGSWSIGVMKESAKRKNQVETGFWELNFLNGEYRVVSPPLPDKVLPVQKLQKVRVQLHWNKGTLSFFDLDTEKPIYTFKHTFTEKLFPYICTGCKVPLKISPVSVTVAVNHAIPMSAGFSDF